MEALLFDGRALVRPLRLDGLAERTVIAGSMSKEHRMIGWRVGWIAGPEPVVARRRLGARLQHDRHRSRWPGAPPTAVLRGPQQHVAQCAQELQRRRDTIFEALHGLPLVQPGGGWSLLLDTTALGRRAAPTPPAPCSSRTSPRPAMTGWGAEVAARHIALRLQRRAAGATRRAGGAGGR